MVVVKSNLIKEGGGGSGANNGLQEEFITRIGKGGEWKIEHELWL